MMPQILLIPFMVLFVFLHLYHKQMVSQNRAKPHWYFKASATIVTIVIGTLALWQSGTKSYWFYTLLIVAGLVLSLIGDIALELTHPQAFLSGMIAFALAHISYIAAFFVAQAYSGVITSAWRDVVAGLALTVLGMLFYYYVHRHLGQFRVPVLFYIVIISIMLHRAVSSADYGVGIPLQPAFAVAGAMCFYVSDFILALNKFVFEDDSVQGGAIVLGFYYLAQLMLALSASFL
jgi:uncharacterized membrane protein YhhN